MIKGEYKNIILVASIMIALFAFMAFTWFVVIKNINNGRSCYNTCDKEIILPKE
jgi:hypothetical protein